jgi:hypothetical protein
MSNCVEIFKTDVSQADDATALVKLLLQKFPHYIVNFDLEDCDLILRVESPHQEVDHQRIIHLLNTQGYNCTLLT